MLEGYSPIPEKLARQEGSLDCPDGQFLPWIRVFAWSCFHSAEIEWILQDLQSDLPGFAHWPPGLSS